MKTNNDVLEQFDQMNGAKIGKLVWIAADPENREIADMMVDIVDSDAIEGVFPDIPQNDAVDYEDGEDLRQLLIDYRKFGFLAEVLLPHLCDFSFNDQGEPESWSIHGGRGNIAYVYAETTDELVDKIQVIADEHFRIACRTSNIKSNSINRLRV